MPASLRIIKIVKDKDPMTNEEKEDYTVEIECEAEDSAKLALELAKCPYGEEIMAMLKRAEFMPAEVVIGDIKAQAEAEQKEIDEHDEKLRAEGREEAIGELKDILRSKTGTSKALNLIVKYEDEQRGKANE